VPPQLLGVAISRCAALCGPHTSVYRNALVRHRVAPQRSQHQQRQQQQQRPAVSTDNSAARCAQDTIMVERAPSIGHEEIQVEVSLYQQGLSRIDCVARCVAGGHHQCCLRKLRVFTRELTTVTNAQLTRSTDKIATLN
jgi:membrane protease subunit (stomatin/prohibitin family)